MISDIVSKFYRNKKVLITGGLGLIGSTVANELVKMGAKVSIIDNLDNLYGGNLFNINDIKDEIELHINDIRNEKLLSSLIRKNEILFNFAAQVSYVDSNIDPINDLDLNCRAQLLILEISKKVNPEIKILFSGSRMQYGKIESIPVDEKASLNPLSIYGAHKLAAENYHSIYYNLYGLRTISFRIANPYGPRNQMKHNKYGIVNYFIKLAMQGGEITIFGDGSQIRDYIFVDDLASAFIYAPLKEKSIGETFNIGSGVCTKLIDMANCICDTVGRGRVKQVPWPENYERIETGDYISNIEKAKNCFNWYPKTSFNEGVKITVKFYEKFGEKYIQ